MNPSLRNRIFLACFEITTDEHTIYTYRLILAPNIEKATEIANNFAGERRFEERGIWYEVSSIVEILDLEDLLNQALFVIK